MKRRVLSILLVMAMVLSLTPLAVLAEDYPSITFNEEFLVELESDMSVWYQFTPEETQYYQVTSSNPDVVDPICKIYNSEMNLIAENDDEDGSNFKCILELTAGETYYFEFLQFDSNNEGSYSVTLTYAMPTDLWMDEYAITSYTGNAFVLGIGMYPYDVPVNLTWTSSDNSVATVDENGLVTCVGVGNTAITVAVGGLSDTCHITVKDGGVPIYLDDVKTVTFIPKEQRETAQTFCFVPEVSGAYRMYSYDIVSTTEEAVDPRIWVRDAFETEIGYNDDGGYDVNSDVQCRLEAGKPYYFEVEPYDPQAAGQVTVTLVKCIDAESITIDGGDLVVDQGEVRDIYVTFSPENCAKEDYTCSSSDESVVKIDGKTALFVGGGEATITVTSENGLTDSINVTVNSIPEIFVDTTYTLEFTASDYEGSQRYSFVPTESGVYRFESFNIDGNWDPCVVLNDQYEQLRYCEDNGEDLNFLMDHELTAGETYYIDVAADCEDLQEDGSVDFKITKVDSSDFPVITMGAEVDVTINNGGNNKFFCFKPTASGMYSIYSTKPDDEDVDPKAVLFDENWEEIAVNDDGASDSNYLIEKTLYAGRTYYIKSFIFSPDYIGTHVLHIDFISGPNVQTITVEDVEITNDETKTLGTTFSVDNAESTLDTPKLFIVNEGEYTPVADLSFESSETYTVSYEFSKADFADGVNTKTFVFGTTVDGDWYYSNEFTVTFTAVTFTLGDVNDDGEINSVDYMLVRRACAGTYELTEEQELRADVSKNSSIDSIDYILIRRVCAGTYVIE